MITIHLLPLLFHAIKYIKSQPYAKIYNNNNKIILLFSSKTQQKNRLLLTCRKKTGNHQRWQWERNINIIKKKIVFMLRDVAVLQCTNQNTNLQSLICIVILIKKIKHTENKMIIHVSSLSFTCRWFAVDYVCAEGHGTLLN